jgi:hypothetical protein
MRREGDEQGQRPRPQALLEPRREVGTVPYTTAALMACPDGKLDVSACVPQ